MSTWKDLSGHVIFFSPKPRKQSPNKIQKKILVENLFSKNLTNTYSTYSSSPPLPTPENYKNHSFPKNKKREFVHYKYFYPKCQQPVTDFIEMFNQNIYRCSNFHANKNL